MHASTSNGIVGERDRAILTAIGQIEKQFGKGAIMRLGDLAGRDRIAAIPTGAIALDLALGIGGVPRGRIVEIYGPEGGGKTTLATHIVAEAQKLGGVCGYIDAEHAFDLAYAGRLGVAVDELLVAQPDTGEQALEICEALVRSGALDVVVVDSVAALVPRAEIDGDMGDSHVGLQARLMSQALRKLAGAIAKSRCVVIFINQLRMKIGVLYGNPETTSGGNALKFYASVRLDIRRVEPIKQGADITGGRHRVKVVKNKVAPPHRVAEFDIMFDEGISAAGNLLDVGVELGIMTKSGAFYALDGERLGQGRENAKQFLKANPALADELARRIMAAAAAPGGLPVEVGAAGGEDDPDDRQLALVV
jgi:recombination protein RecA